MPLTTLGVAGPMYDCVVFHDGSVWRAAVDPTETGDFSSAAAFTNFRAERQWGTLGEKTLLNYALNIYDEGTTLSIVTDAGAHGSHVSGICAAYHEDNPALNGVAPGAQIVAVKVWKLCCRGCVCLCFPLTLVVSLVVCVRQIGDTRLGSMETGGGLSRGLRAVVENNCDLINMRCVVFAMVC